MECQRSSIRRLGRAGVNVEFRNSYDHREGDQNKAEILPVFHHLGVDCYWEQLICHVKGIE